MNMGYWTYVSPRLVTAVGNKPKIRFVKVNILEPSRLLVFLLGCTIVQWTQDERTVAKVKRDFKMPRR